MLSHYKDFLESQGNAEVALTSVAAEQWDEGFDVEALPDIQPAKMPKPASTAKVCHSMKPLLHKQ